MPVSQPAYSLIGNKIVSLALASTLITGKNMDTLNNYACSLPPLTNVNWSDLPEYYLPTMYISYIHWREILIWLGMCSSITVSRISVFCYTSNKLTYGTIQLQLHTTVLPQACFPTCFRHVYKASFLAFAVSVHSVFKPVNRPLQA